MKTSESLDQFGAAFAPAQAAFGAAQKSAKNPHLKTRYADLASTLAAARVAMGEHGLSVVQGVQSDPTTVSVTTRIIHSSGQWVESSLSLPWGPHKGLTSVQCIGSAITYARRYALMGMLGLAPEEEDDGAGAGHAQKTQPHRHHPSWHAKKGAFLAELGKLGLTYDDLLGILAKIDRPRPSTMTEEKRQKLLGWLRDRQAKADEAAKAEAAKAGADAPQLKTNEVLEMKERKKLLEQIADQTASLRRSGVKGEAHVKRALKAAGLDNVDTPIGELALEQLRTYMDAIENQMGLAYGVSP